MSLVEILTLVLLAGILVLLVLIFNNIAAARRTLEEGERTRQTAAAPAGGRAGAGYEGAGAAGGYGGGGAGAGTEGYAPAAGYGAPSGGGYTTPTPGYETRPGGGYGAGTAPQTSEQPSYAGAEPTSDYATWSESASTGAGQAGAGTGAAVEEFPEETPFEREGRWWFKRGDELLIYDEQAGQWIAPPPGTTPGGGTSTGQPSGGSGGYGYDTGGGAAEAATSSTAVGEPGGWRCPSCGAINGASATTCRMCFSARP